MKIYYAGALFTLAERMFNKEIATQLRERGHEIFLPQEKQGGTIPAPTTKE